jgi:hypothetical protein
MGIAWGFGRQGLRASRASGVKSVGNFRYEDVILMVVRLGAGGHVYIGKPSEDCRVRSRCVFDELFTNLKQ